MSSRGVLLQDHQIFRFISSMLTLAPINELGHNAIKPENQAC